MKAYHSCPARSDSSHSRPTSAFPSSAKISDPLKTLLVVDDDHEVRQLEAEILRQEGYNVLQAESAAEALRVAASTAAIHLLITDFSMPEIDGLELTNRFRVVHPKIPVLMISGSLPSLRDRNEDDLDRVELLAKPFAFNELLRKVRALLDAARGEYRPGRISPERPEA
jgi:DNA-binding response OmpR family regulator